MPHKPETTLLRMPRRQEEFGIDLELRVSLYQRGVNIRQWWFPPLRENAVPSPRGIVVRPDELDDVIGALVEARRLLHETRAPWRKDVPCPQCQEFARQNSPAQGESGATPSDYCCDLCGAVRGPLSNEPPVIDLRDDANHYWLHEVHRRRLERERRKKDQDA